MSKRVAVIGAGSWGTALAIHSVNCGHSVRLWVHSPDTLKILQQTRVNAIYLPDFKLPQEIEITSDHSCVSDADYILFAVPSVYFRRTFETFIPHLKEKAVLISSIKGMEADTRKRISEIVEDLSGNRFIYSVLSGPSFAQEVALHYPTAVVIGSTHEEIAKQIQQDFRSSYFRLYYNNDVTGIEVAASIKNIIAIASGVVTGLGYGYNTTAGLITRGVAELSRLAIKIGAKSATMSGLAGLGDLVLTCTGPLSRNRTVGVELGRGKKIQEIMSETRMVAEGIRTAEAIYNLSQQLQVSMPITEQVYKVLYKDHDPRTAILELMSRDLKQE
jgi:glycerol-3-phosphate dehydrogenase (NAD(P)+)